MQDFFLDLDREIAELKQRSDELDALWPNPPGPSANDKADQREQIQAAMQEISNRLLTLRTVRLNKAASRVTITALSEQEYNEIQSALADLSRVIQREQTFAQSLETITIFFHSIFSVPTSSRAVLS